MTTSSSPPVALRPEMVRYTVFVDGVSKAFAEEAFAFKDKTLGGATAPKPRAEQIYFIGATNVPLDRLGEEPALDRVRREHHDEVRLLARLERRDDPQPLGVGLRAALGRR